MGYSGAAIKGVGWSGGLKISLRIITVVRTAFLARLLTPSQFGLFGIATIALAFLEVFLETGVNVFLIQEKSDIKKYIDSAWVVSIARGIVMSLLLLAASPAVANFFNSSSSLGVLMLISVVPLLRGFINPSIVNFHKEIQFHKEFFYRVSLFAVDSIFTIVIAWWTHSVYSLVIGVILSVLIEIYISFKFAVPRPKFAFNSNYVKRIFHRGKWVTLFGIFGYLAQEGDTIAVGRLMNTAALGQYNMAYSIATLPIDATEVISPVVFPVYVRISHDIKRLLRAFIKTTLLLTIATTFACAFIYLFAYQIVSIFLGSQWLTIIPVLKILLIYGILRATFGSASALFLSVGKQKYVSLMTFFRVFGLIITIVPFIMQWGLVGAAYSVIFSVLLEIPVVIYLVYKIFK